MNIHRLEVEQATPGAASAPPDAENVLEKMLVRTRSRDNAMPWREKAKRGCTFRLNSLKNAVAKNIQAMTS